MISVWSIESQSFIHWSRSFFFYFGAVQVDIRDRMLSFLQILILSCQMVFKSFANSCHHLRSLSLEWHEKPGELSCCQKVIKETWWGSIQSRPHWEWRSQWEDPWCHLSILSSLPESPSDHFFGEHTMRMRCLHNHLLISLNLIIRSCVKVDVHCLQWGMLQHGG